MAQYPVHGVPVANPSPTSSPTAPASATVPQGAQHKRVYQACIPCRRRKVRCDLGSVDNPSDPPCVRCRRESKECFFSATRRKRKTDEDGSDHELDEYIVRNGRKRLHASGSPPPIDRRLYSDTPLTPGGSQGRREPLRRPNGPVGFIGVPGAGGRRGDVSAGEDSNVQMENLEARSVMRQGVYGPHDALDLLYKAATDSPVTGHRREQSTTSTATLPPQPLPTGAGHALKPSLQETLLEPSVKLEAAIDPALMKRELSTEPGYTEALKAWTRFRFVRAGWFTAQEAIEYIDYYYAYLSPLTPISPPTFRNPASHTTLLTEEPILTITLLTIASRYRKLPGTGGVCRSNAIHEQLWTYLRGMIERCLWGQEAFGTGFCPPAGSAGSATTDDGQTSSTAPWRGLRKGSLRTLGTIESLMILTEWHPRALHFPPAEAIDELMLPAYAVNEAIGMDEDGNPRQASGIGGRRIESWLEPAWRSDRMCWMLLSTAMGLAYELGVFDDIDQLLRDGAIDRPEYEEETYRQRAYRIKRLLLIYVTQLAGRLGWTNMVPEALRKSDPAVSRRRPASGVEGTTPGTNPSSLSNAFNYIPDLELDDQIIHCWAGISNAMHIGNEKLFKSRKHTTEIIQNSRYIELLKDFQPMLRDWWTEFARFPLPPYIRHILTIEYEYVRIYINSLSLQAVVERCTNAGSTANAGQGNAGGSTAQLSPQTQNYYGKLPLGQLGGFGAADQEYVKEVVDGCRNLLSTVVKGLLPGDYLKHAPVRTYFRIISGAMFLLKTFALGAPRSDVKRSIDLMDSTVQALRTCVVDDVHLGIRFADLLESLTSRLRNRFIQAPTIQAASSDARSPNPHSDAAVNGASGASCQVNGTEGPGWTGHSNKPQEGLNGQDRLGSPPVTNISATPFDLSTGNFPYPSGSASALNPSTPAAIDNGMDSMYDEWTDPNNEMWYLPPGPAFFQNMENNTVMTTAEGVNVNGWDLLDFMTMDTQYPNQESSYP